MGHVCIDEPVDHCSRFNAARWLSCRGIRLSRHPPWSREVGDSPTGHRHPVASGFTVSDAEPPGCARDDGNKPEPAWRAVVLSAWAAIEVRTRLAAGNVVIFDGEIRRGQSCRLISSAGRTTHGLPASAHQPVNRRHAVGSFPNADVHLRVWEFHECHNLEFMSEQS